MLVLSRNRNQDSIITCPDGTRITVTVMDIQEGRVRLGFTAPRTYGIHRRELLENEREKTT